MKTIIKIGAFVFAIEVSAETAAQSVGEYVRDGIDAGLGVAAVYDGARVAARYASVVIEERWADDYLFR